MGWIIIAVCFALGWWRFRWPYVMTLALILTLPVIYLLLPESRVVRGYAAQDMPQFWLEAAMLVLQGLAVSWLAWSAGRILGKWVRRRAGGPARA